MLAVMADFLGTTWWSILCFVAGGLIAGPLWKMIRSKMNW
jgi:hypothetical protein